MSDRLYFMDSLCVERTAFCCRLKWPTTAYLIDSSDGGEKRWTRTGGEKYLLHFFVRQIASKEAAFYRNNLPRHLCRSKIKFRSHRLGRSSYLSFKTVFNSKVHNNLSDRQKASPITSPHSSSSYIFILISHPSTMNRKWRQLVAQVWPQRVECTNDWISSKTITV